MKKLWLIFAQTATVCLAIIFVVATLKPQWLGRQPGGRGAAVALFEAPASLPGEVPPGSLRVAAQKASAAVVSISTSQAAKKKPNANDPWFKFFYGDQGSEAQGGLGSGVIVSQSGYILTNNHVVEGADEIEVVLNDSRHTMAKVVGTDPDSDLAVLKIGLDKLPTIVLGNSDTIQVGDQVLAIGNPFGVGQTVTSGIVSALARTQVGVSDYQFFIQTDAAINPGNSGGALVDMKGELIGINTAIFSRSGGSIGIGFAIPTNMVKTIVATAESGGVAIKRPWIGAEVQDVTPDIATSLGMARPEGALIVSLHPDSPLAKAGLKRGDIVLALEGKPIETAQELGYRIATTAVGATAIIEYQRKGDRKETQVTMMVAPETVKRDDTLIEGPNPLAGATATNVSPAVADELDLPADSQGVAITKIDNGPAMRFFKRGDIVLEVNGAKIDSVDALNAALADNQNLWRIAINRGGRVVKMAIGG